jgi:Ig-like domain from next to BRCA1 gene
MSRIRKRILGLWLIAFSLCACGAGSTAQNSTATETQTMVTVEMPADTALIMAETPTLGQEAAESPTGEFTMEETVNATFTPTSMVAGNATSTKRASGPLCNDAVFVSDITIPDGTVLRPEQPFEKIWRMKNTGVCQWTTSYGLGYAYGYRMNGDDIKLLNSVDPGVMIDVSVTMVAPKEIGWYGGWWRLKSDKGVFFGDFIYVSVLVSIG